MSDRELELFTALPQSNGVEVHVHPPYARLFRDADRDPIRLYEQARSGTLKIAPIAAGIKPDRQPDPLHAQIGKLPMKYFRDYSPRFIWHPARRRFHSITPPASWLFDPGWEDDEIADLRVRRWLENRVFDVVTSTSALQELISWARYFDKPLGVLLVPDHLKAYDALMELAQQMTKQWNMSAPFRLMFPRRHKIDTTFNAIPFIRREEIIQFDTDTTLYWEHGKNALVHAKNRNLSLFIVPSLRADLTSTLKEAQVFLEQPLDFVAQIGPCTNVISRALYGKVKRNTSIYWKLGWTKADTLYQRMAQYSLKLRGKEFLEHLAKLANS